MSWLLNLPKFDDGTVHVLPVGDLREHNASWLCWCNPIPDTQQESVAIHNAMDERERYEEGRLKS